MSVHGLASLLENTQELPFAVVSHGCKVNRVESDTVAAQLFARGARMGALQAARLVIVNTCTVTGEADKKARKAVRHALKEAPEALVVVTGCGVAIDPRGYASLDPRVCVIERAELMALVDAGEGGALRAGCDFRTRVNLKIQDGCDHACTYCIVHVARGKARSVPAAEVLAEARAYLERGTKEIVLTGIDLGSFRDGDIDLADLVSRILHVADEVSPAFGHPPRVRASSLEPMTIGDDFVDLLARSDGRVCRHLHVPLQSGSTKVLREMGRPYSAEEYALLVERLRASIEGLSLTTDIIVGFPGETDEDFAQTVALARACRFSKIHVFPYSRRAGTPAASRPDQVDSDVMHIRASQLRAVSDELRSLDRASRSGATELAVVESRFALSESYHELPIPFGAKIGELVPVTFG